MHGSNPDPLMSALGQKRNHIEGQRSPAVEHLTDGVTASEKGIRSRGLLPPSLRFLGTVALGGVILGLLLSYQWGHEAGGAFG